jgi:GDP-D-mannose dehydratase
MTRGSFFGGFCKNKLLYLGNCEAKRDMESRKDHVYFPKRKASSRQTPIDRLKANEWITTHTTLFVDLFRQLGLE